MTQISRNNAAECALVDSSSGFEYTFLPAHMQIIGHIKLPNSRSAEFVVAPEDRAAYWTRPKVQAQQQRQEQGQGQGHVKKGKGKEVEEHVQQRQRRDEEEEKEEEEKEEEEKEEEEEEEEFLLSPPPVAVDVAAAASSVSNTHCNTHSHTHKRLKVGIVSSDFGVHPVATLVRGFIDKINTTKIELFAFSLRKEMSWWGRNISNSVENFILLPQINTRDAAATVAAYGIEILIDLNGHTQYSGLRMMAHQPAPLQVSFLGLPTSTGTSFIDYYLGDSVALPPEHVSHFTESLSLLPNCYISNDYAQLQGDMVDFIAPATGSQALRASRSALKTDFDASSQNGTEFLFATFSNTQKLEPSVYSLWANILRGIPNSKILNIQHTGFEEGVDNLRTNALYHGVKKVSAYMASNLESREEREVFVSSQVVIWLHVWLHFYLPPKKKYSHTHTNTHTHTHTHTHTQERILRMPHAPWLEHLYVKSAIDMVLDTPIKNGHTTGLDGIWAGRGECVSTVRTACHAAMPCPVVFCVCYLLHANPSIPTPTPTPTPTLRYTHTDICNGHAYELTSWAEYDERHGYRAGIGIQRQRLRRFSVSPRSCSF